MSILDIFKVSQIKRENKQLHDLFEKINATEAIEVQKKIANLKDEMNSLTNDNTKLTKELNNLKEIISNKKKEIIVLDDELLLESFALYKPKFSFMTSDEYKNRLEEIRAKQKQMIKDGIAASGNQNWTVNNSKVQGKKMVNDMIKLVLRSFNNECDYCNDQSSYSKCLSRIFLFLFHSHNNILIIPLQGY